MLEVTEHITTETKYKVGNQTFSDRNAAQRYAARHALQEWADEIGLCRGGQWNQRMVLDAIDEHSIHLEAVISTLNQAR